MLSTKPPIQTPDKYPLTGTGNKIDRLGIGSDIIDLYSRNKSQKEIVRIINEKYKLTGSVNQINQMNVSRYIRKHNISDTETYEENHAINVYEQECEMLKSVNMIAETIELELDNYRDELKMGKNASNLKYVKDLVLAVEKLYARKLALIGSIKNTQEKIYGFAAAQAIVSKIMNIIQEKNIELFADIKAEIASDPMMQECFRKIQGSRR